MTGPTVTPGTALAAAVAVLARHGYVALGTASYAPQDTLHVLIGSERDGARPGERAFFFDQGAYIGTDASTPSDQIAVVAHSDSEVALRYALTAGGSREVHFALDMGQLSALDPLPSDASRG